MKFKLKEKKVNELQLAQKRVEIGRATQRLLNNADFKLVFEEQFHNDYMRTVGVNYATATQGLRDKFQEQIAARGIVISFIQQVMTEAQQAFDFIEATRQESEDAARQEQIGEDV